MVIRTLLLLVCALLLAWPASARVTVPERAVFAIGDGECNSYVDGCKFGIGSPTNAEAESGYLKVIKDGASSIDAFFLRIPDNSAKSLQRLTWFNTAMRQWNAANPTMRRCIAPMYSAAGGDLRAILDAADAGGADSPLCQMDGKAMIGAFGRGKCVNPVDKITGRGTFVVLGAVTAVPGNMADATCVNTWKAGGAARVLNVLWTQEDANLTNFSTYQAATGAAISAGSEFVMGVGSGKSINCGTDACAGSASAGYEYTDENGFATTLRSLRAPFRDSRITKVVLNMSHPGNFAQSSYFDGGMICDADDTVTKTGVTCPTVPDHLRGTIPSRQEASNYDLKAFTHRGHKRILDAWKQIFLSSNASPAPFVAFTYREHPYAIDASGFGICSGAALATSVGSLGGSFTGDTIDFTSWSPSPIKVRLKFGATTVWSGTLPAEQLSLDTGGRQQTVALGANRGRPTVEILDENNNIIASKEGEVSHTDTPTQWGGATGRNYAIYSDYVDVPQGGSPSSATLSVQAVNADRAEGNTGQSLSEFKAVLSQPRAVDTVVSWTVSSTAANEQDFFYTRDLSAQSQCADATPPPAAAAAGLTALEFCDDFTVASVNPDGYSLRPQDNWTRDIAQYGNNTLLDTPPENITFSGGVARIVGFGDNQWDLSTAYMDPTGAVHGYIIDRKKEGFYTEIRWKFDGEKTVSSGFPAFWSMDACHTQRGGTLPDGTVLACDRGGEYLEPDHVEMINGNMHHSLHYHDESGGKIANCSGFYADDIDHSQWYVAGNLYLPGLRTEAYENDIRKLQKLPTRGCAPKEQTPEGYDNTMALPLSLLSDGRYPLHLGTGPDWPMDVDWVKVWVHPTEHRDWKQ